MIAPSLTDRLAQCRRNSLGPHAGALLEECLRAARNGLPLAVVVLTAAIIDVVAHEEAGPAGHIDGMDFAYAGNKAALGWLRGRRNAVLHHEGPTDGLMGEAGADDWQWRDANRAVEALLGYLDDLMD